jgi:hypothetical protein
MGKRLGNTSLKDLGISASEAKSEAAEDEREQATIDGAWNNVDETRAYRLRARGGVQTCQ